MNKYIGTASTLLALTAALGGCIVDPADPEEEVASGSDALAGWDAYNVDVAYNPAHDVYLAVWDQQTGTPQTTDANVFGAIHAGDGRLVAGPFAISDAPGFQARPKVATDGKDFIVVWEHLQSSAQVRTTLVDASGNVSTPGGDVVRASGATRPDVAFSNGGYLVVWTERRNASDADIYGSRIDTAGVVLDAGGGVLMRALPGRDTDPAVAGNGSEFLVGWSHFDQSSGGDDIVGTIVKTVPGIVPNALIKIGTSTDQDRRVALASDGSEYCAVWERGGDSVSQYGESVSARRVSRRGAALGQAQLSTIATAHDARPAITFMDDRYMVSRIRRAITPGQNSEVRGQRLAWCDPTGNSFRIGKLAGRDGAQSVASTGSLTMTVWTNPQASSPACSVCGSVGKKSGSQIFPNIRID